MDHTADSLTAKEREMDANDPPRRNRLTISIFVLSGNTTFLHLGTNLSYTLIQSKLLQ